MYDAAWRQSSLVGHAFDQTVGRFSIRGARSLFRAVCIVVGCHDADALDLSKLEPSVDVHLKEVL